MFQKYFMYSWFSEFDSGRTKTRVLLYEKVWIFFFGKTHILIFVGECVHVYNVPLNSNSHLGPHFLANGYCWYVFE